MIDAYQFGHMVIDGISFRKDVIISSNGEVHSPWWREQGHLLQLKDMELILHGKPKAIIIGTGEPGFMKPAAGLIEELEAQGFTVFVLPTKEAAQKFNNLSKGDNTVVACFHLTC